MVNRKVGRILGVRRRGDVIEVRIKDLARNVYFKRKSNVNDKEKIREILDSLRHFNVDVNEIMRIPRKEKQEKKKEEKDTWW